MTLRQGKDIDGELWGAAQSNSEVTNPGQLNNCHNCLDDDDNRYREYVDGQHYSGTSVTIMVMTIAIMMTIVTLAMTAMMTIWSPERWQKGEQIWQWWPMEIVTIVMTAMMTKVTEMVTKGWKKMTRWQKDDNGDLWRWAASIVPCASFTLRALSPSGGE